MVRHFLSAGGLSRVAVYWAFGIARVPEAFFDGRAKFQGMGGRMLAAFCVLWSITI